VHEKSPENALGPAAGQSNRPKIAWRRTDPARLYPTVSIL
jgi:hypothetical protein